MKSITFLAPKEISGHALNKLHKGLESRFRFNYERLDTMPLSNLIEIKYSSVSQIKNGGSIENQISDYVNGFFAAIE